MTNPGRHPSTDGVATVRGARIAYTRTGASAAADTGPSAVADRSAGLLACSGHAADPGPLAVPGDRADSGHAADPGPLVVPGGLAGSGHATNPGPLAVYAHALSHDRDSLAGPGALLDLTPVTATHTLLRYDARGHGESSGTPRPGDYTASELADDLLALLDEWAPAEPGSPAVPGSPVAPVIPVEPGGQVGPVAGIGTSMGTATLLHAATRRPERFSRLVLTAPPTAWALRAGQADVYRALADAVERDGLASMLDGFRAAATPPVLRDTPVEPRIAEPLLPTVLRGVATSDLPDPAAVAGLRMPVLILSWAGDPGHPVATGERLHDLIAGSRFEVAQSRATRRR